MSTTAGILAGAALASSNAGRSTPSRSVNTPVANEGRVRARDMTDVYDGVGEGRIGSPRSPTRPHSMRRRQSMQVLELENKVQELIAENRSLAEAKVYAEQTLQSKATTALAERDAQIEQLKQNLAYLQKEVARLKEVNEGLNSANSQLAQQHGEQYRLLEARHASANRQLESSRAATVKYESALEEKDAEIERLRAELEETKQQIKDMQKQILELHKPTADASFLKLKDIDYFDTRCNQLCSHVQQWVLRFSKFSDMRPCRLTSELNDDELVERLDNAILDGTEVDEYLNDRVRRRDVFMSITMSMIWQFVFTRYLFGMDREQRQKLKTLEKLLQEVGPPQAVRQWRAVTLTLLSRRPTFKTQRDQDTEAVVQAVFKTLSKILPPPSNLEGQIQTQLRRVMREAVDLSVEMRTQRSEYMMLPPLQPEYDADGGIAQVVTFDASLMHERSGDPTLPDGDSLQAKKSAVRLVLFPLVVRKGDDDGVGDDEVVVCPAQVLIASAHRARSRSRTPSKHTREPRETIRVVTPVSEVGGVSLGGQSGPSHSNVSMTSGPSGGAGIVPPPTELGTDMDG